MTPEPISFHTSHLDDQMNTGKPKLFLCNVKAAVENMEDTIKDMQSLNGFPIVFK
jgi:hypothetical protein